MASTTVDRHRANNWPLRLVGCLMFLALGVSGCSRDEDPPKTVAVSTVPVGLQLPWVYQAQFAGPIVAALPGSDYERNGLEVQIDEGGVDSAIVQRIANGASEFGVMQPDQLIFYNAREPDPSKRLVSIAVVFPQSMTCFMVRKDSGIKTIEDFRGKRIGVKENTNVDNEFNALLAQAGLARESDVTTVPVRWDLGLFTNGDLDVFPGFSINEPFQARKSGVAVELLTPSQFGLELYGDVLVTSQVVIDEKPEVVRAFVAATLDGWKRAFNQPEVAIEAVLERNQLLEIEHQEFMLNASKSIALSGSGPFGSQDADVWANMVRVLENYGGLPTGTVDPSSLFTNDFLP